ncbi:MAG: hypothetical protein DI586_09590 [Micavibrio aeruginosavorus]|uniref:Uncharacterized protein n=1 Tax=Micavibrio aeruginosavorus TaxID=349221 RepID=A0A2W5H907_9BACT|nr:MAG: hypothetical protein DI586_09590 [Micavibrio aeruginosavorus]
MKLALFICLMFLAALPGLAFASSNAPPAPKLKVENEENGPISIELANQVYENCVFHIPSRFTPEAREYYCACNSASLRGNFKMNEYRELQRQSNRKPGNKSFDKYIKTSVAPCLDMPVEQIEYLACLLDTSNDVRVGYVPGFCGCVSKKMKTHAKAMAEVEIMEKLSSDPNAFKDPVDALWNNTLYLRTKYNSRDECLLEGK